MKYYGSSDEVDELISQYMAAKKEKKDKEAVGLASQVLEKWSSALSEYEVELDKLERIIISGSHTDTSEVGDNIGQVLDICEKAGGIDYTELPLDLKKSYYDCMFRATGLFCRDVGMDKLAEALVAYV